MSCLNHRRIALHAEAWLAPCLNYQPQAFVGLQSFKGIGWEQQHHPGRCFINLKA